MEEKTALLQKATMAIAPLLQKIKDLNAEKRLISEGKGSRSLDEVNAEEATCYDQMAPLHEDLHAIFSQA